MAKKNEPEAVPDEQPEVIIDTTGDSTPAEPVSATTAAEVDYSNPGHTESDQSSPVATEAAPSPAAVQPSGLDKWVFDIRHRPTDVWPRDYEVRIKLPGTGGNYVRYVASLDEACKVLKGYCK